MSFPIPINALNVIYEGFIKDYTSVRLKTIFLTHIINFTCRMSLETNLTQLTLTLKAK